MKKIYTYLQLGLWLIIAMAIPQLGFAQTCDVTPMNISKIATDWTTNCARVATDACDPTNGPLCDGTQSSNWLLLNPNDYCLPKAPCNAVGFSKVEVNMTMEGTWRVKNIGNLSQNTSVGLLGCIKAWMCDLLFDPLEPSAFTGIITLAAGEEKNGPLPTRTKTSAYPGDLDALFAKNCSDKVCIEGLADGFTTLTISNGNLQAITTVFASLKACVNYKKFDWSVTGSEAACETSSDGKVFVSFTPAPGTSASDYEIRVGNGGTWTVAQTAVSGANTISGLPSGSYTVAVVYKPLANTVVPSDNESCGYCKSSVTVASATATLACSSTPDCPGGTGDGTVSVSVTGSNLGTVKYLWGNGANTSAITGLTPGNYSVTVTYGPNDKCSKITTCTVVAAPGVDADVTFTNVKCKDAADGTITVDPTTGTASFTISVTGKSNQTSTGTSKTFTGFGPGTYTVTVTDKNGCVYTEMVTITEPPAITGSITPTPAACTGATNGSATVSASGGTGSYTYNWSRGTVVMGGTQVTGLTPGSISVTITDANNCTKVLTSTIGTVSEVSITCTPTPEKCVDENNGSVSVAVSNASPNYVASWVSGPTQFSQVSSPTSPVVVNNLKPGNYKIRITDNNGCYAECNFTIAEGLDLPCSISGSTSICQGVTENIHSVQSVTSATYAWTLESNSAGASIPGITTNSTVTVSIPSNATGAYTIRMTISKDGCSKSCTKTVTITQPIACTINGPASVCEGSTATFTTSAVTNRVWTVSGGLNFTGQGTNSITVTIPDGTVLSSFTVGLSGTGSNGCPTNCSTTTTINQKPEVTIEPTSPVCNLGTPQGAIQATASGAAPFVYRLYKHSPSRTLVSTSASTANTVYNFTNLGPGTYDVEVTDANNCTSDPSATIILVTPVGFEPELDCETRNAGNIDIVLNISNGTGPFTYSLDNNTFSAVPANGIITIPFVDGSNQTIYLKDANNCPAISETILLQCCKLEGVCKLTQPSQLTGCDYSVVPAAKTNPADVFSNIAFCEEAKIKVTTTDGGSLCGDGLTRTYTYILYDDLNDNDKFDEDDEPFISGTCAETYVVKAPTLSCNAPTDYSIKETCTTQNIANLFSTWKNAFTYTGGCSPMIRYLVSINDGVEVEYQSIANITAPTYCGGKVKIKILVKDACTAEKMCMSTFFVPTRPTLVAAGPESVTKPTCASTTDFATWKAAFQYTSGGCNYKIKYEVSIDGGNLTVVANLNDVVAPSSCGGSVRIKMTVTDDCDQSVVKDATYTVPTRPTLVAAGPENVTKEACASTSDFATWKAAFKYTSGGCNYKIKYEVSIDGGSLTVVANLNNVVAPSSCGGSVRIKITVTDDCDQSVVKDATYTVPTRPTLVAAGPDNVTKDACASTSDFASWKAAFQYTSGGCNYKIKYEVSINGGALTTVANLSNVLAPSSCGGSVRIKMTVTDDCDQTVVKDATYTVPTRPTLVAAGPENVTKEACASTSDFAAWKAAFQYTSGGCNYKIKYEVSINGGSLTVVANLTNVVAPSSCGGSVRIKMTVTDDCDQTVVKDATYTVLTRPDLVINLPADKTVRCLLQGGINTEFAAWIAQFNTSGGCSATVKYYVNDKEVANLNGVDAPSECGGKVTIKIVMSDVCDQTLTKSAYFKAIPKPVGLPIEKNIYSCIAVNVDLQLQVKCDVQSTFKWYSVASVGSSVPYNHPQIDGETFNPAGTSAVITDLLTNLTTTTQTIIYRVVPTSIEDCEGDPFYVTVNIRQKADIQCLACVTEVRVSLDKNCRLLITPDLVIDGFEQCPNRELLRDALEVLIEDGNNDNYVDCAGAHKYLVRLKPEYEACFDYAPCWGTIIAEDKTGPILECANFIDEPLDCYDVNYVLNNRLTIGNVGATSSPRPSASSSQTINNAEGIADDSACGLKPASLVSDNIKNLGYPFFRDNCRDCGCRTTLKWSDRVEYYSCEQMEKNGGIYARIFRQWVATDCNGMTADTVQVIDFKRPKISEFTFNGGGEGKYDRVVEYNACAPDKNLIKKEDVTPFICSYFNTTANPRCLYLDQVECNYSVQIKDTEFPICNGKGVKIDREMYIFDWCAGGIVDTLHILIKIGDFEAPTYDYAHGAPFDISTGPMDCTAAIPVTVAGIKSAFGVSIKDNCALGNVSVSVYTKDRYVKGILVYEGPDNPFCQPEPEARKAELRGEHEDFGYCNKEDICWEKVEYAVMNGMMIGLPVGKHLMVIDAFDGCYNASTACFVFEVKDKIAPIMKCDDDLHVTLSNANGYTNGYAQVSAEDIDEGSWDNCKLAWIAVRRNVPDGCAASFIAKGYDTNGNGKLDALPADGDVTKADGFDLNGDGDIADFGETFILKGGKLMTPLLDYVEFFCCDLTERVTVELWGGDIYGNTNYCWMDLLIEDKVAPTCLAPWDVTIYCDDKNIAQIDNKIASAKIFGDVTIPSGNDCAALDTTYTTEKKLKCGAGYIDRIWTLTKQTVKGPISVTCKQRIHILPVHEYNICFPKDVSTDCKTPIIDTVITDELGCDILAVNVHDKRYDASDDECYKIFRTYSVINWCTYDDRCGDPLEQTNISIIDRAVFGNYGKAPIYVLVRDREDNRRDGVEEFYISKDLTANNADDIRFKPYYCEVAGEFYHSFIYTQIIKVYDDTRPVVTGTRDTFCTSPTACTANITKVVTIKDNCTDKVELERQQLMIAPFQTLDAGKMITYSTPRWSTKDLGNGQYEITVSNLPEGTHDLIVVGRDECGNLSVATRIPFVVKDCKAPAPICINGLSTELMPDGNNGGMMAVWASDFVASKIYDCNGQGPETKDGLKLVTKYSINRVGEPVVATQTGLNLTCADAGKVILVELHAWDEAGNHDFCVTFVEVQDNRKVCPDPSNVVTGEISGLVATDEAEPVSGVKIDVSGGAQLNQNTASNGLFNFGKLPVGSDFTLAAQLDKDHLNGVSTFDLVQLQKHILGVQTIKNPYRLIAADVNNSKSISTLDMIQMRKLILNIDERFSNVPSWRFVDAAYKFPDPNNPWVEAFPEVVNVNDLAGKVQANFIAIKMGDVNGNAQVSSTASAEVRSAKALQLQTEEQELKTGQHYAVSIRAKDLASVQGFQFTLQVDPSMAQLENIEYNGVMKADHFGYFPRSGQITSSYVGAPLLVAPLSSTTGESVLFTLHLKAEANLPLSKVLKINSQLTPKEAYDKDDELMDVQLELKGATLSDLAALHQNTPNPFVEETAIGFYLPRASAATLTVRDVKGALLYRLEGNYAKGENQVILKQEQLRSSGVLYYTLETADFTATKKMILLNK